MSKHTPGPWNLYDDTASTGRIEIVALGKTVARIYRSVPEEDLPNARLIAAAPEMLYALKSLKRILTVDSPEWNAADAAIAKATGEQA